MSKKTAINQSIYRITHRDTGETRHTASTNAQDACQSLGWAIGDCHVLNLVARQFTRPDGVKGLMVQVPCLVCPYQFAECQKPPTDPCPYRTNTPDFAAWLSTATKAHLCNHVGQPIFKKDYENGLIWLSEGAAVLYITRRES